MTKRIHITQGWSFHDDEGNSLNPQLFPLLNGIKQTGKLTAATKLAQISYRHGWNLLDQATQFFGSKLVNLEKGRGAKLTSLGDKILWAEQRVGARLQPQMENLASELNIEIHKEMADFSPVLRLYASHGYAVALLPEFADRFQLDLQYKNSDDALAALSRNACDLAGVHIPAEIPVESLIERYSRHLTKRQSISSYRVIRFITRQQGLMVARSNPKAVGGIIDLVRSDIKFINRQKDSGTRALLDKLLSDQNIASDKINTCPEEEFTHTAVAAFVAAGMADVGFGVEAAARQFNLDFIPVTSEHYLMICHERSLKKEAVVQFLAQLRSSAFHSKVAELAGYSAKKCGVIELLQ
jgi:molybdate transport repressor ModE-like protein|tara:strand:+ start:1122 stop:2183 length:1062 start_codon:yes stop_codon:yes gene_type:complete